MKKLMLSLILLCGIQALKAQYENLDTKELHDVTVFEMETQSPVQIVIKQGDPYEIKKHKDYKMLIKKEKVVLKGKKRVIIPFNGKIVMEKDNPLYFIELSEGVELLCSFSTIETISIEVLPTFAHMYFVYKEM